MTIQVKPRVLDKTEIVRYSVRFHDDDWNELEEFTCRGLPAASVLHAVAQWVLQVEADGLAGGADAGLADSTTLTVEVEVA